MLMSVYRVGRAISLPMLHELNAPLTNSCLLALSVKAKAISITEKMSSKKSRS